MPRHTLPDATIKKLLKGGNPKQRVSQDAVEAFRRQVEMAAHYAGRAANRTTVKVWDVMHGFYVTGVQAEKACR